MSTELKSIKCRKETEFGKKESEMKLTRFSGGENGIMVQINIDPDVTTRSRTWSAHVQLTQSQVKDLVKELQEHIL
jgi:hypothetical protein|tara:strand:- start:876 stop:1103 length:228 start_codon:yes stop_codon:yes gene_type:complete